jgi:Xaa-Pro aminopeptidase
MALLFTDFRYQTRAAREAPAFTIKQISRESPLRDALVGIAMEHRLYRLGFEADHVTVAQWQQLNQPIDALETITRPRLQPTTGIVAKLREVKDTTEQATLRRAIAITDDAFAAVVPTLVPEQTERQAAWAFEQALRERGADAVSFDIIVAAGRNAAQPHATPGDAPLGTGQPIIIDMGARYQGYHADMTRTIVLGTPDAHFHAVYSAVLTAQQRALAGVRAAMTGADADALARDYLTEQGYGDAFGHSLGHGVGLHIHEGPTLARTSESLLQAGNVVSIEPGVYLDDWGGVRIEDLVLITTDGCVVLTQTPKRDL